MDNPQEQTLTAEGARTETDRIVRAHPVVDIHTHLFAPRFNQHGPGFLLWGIDELLDYHYLHAEVLRVLAGELTPAALREMSKPDRAELIWRTLFHEHTPISEACRGVVTTLTALGLDPNTDDLIQIRSWFAERELESHTDDVMCLAGVERITMTNEVFDERERKAWFADASLGHDPRFAPVARVDRILFDPDSAMPQLAAWGYDDADLHTRMRHFVNDWVVRTGAVYVAASLPPIAGNTLTPSVKGDDILRESVLPVLAEHGIPLALMIGVRRSVNPDLGSAGDGVGASNLEPLSELCTQAQTSGTKLLVTTLAREDQHAFCVLARKFSNLIPFGCWWFLNTPSLISEITRLRLELLGTTFIPQHSDARVLEQLIYKWSHSREAIARVLGDQFAHLARSGGRVTESLIECEVDQLFCKNALNAIPYETASE